MKTLKKLLFCSICASLFTSFSGEARVGNEDGLRPELSAALCEMACWESHNKTGRDSLLMQKASFLSNAGEHARAYETLCRISSFGLSEAQRHRLLCMKMIEAYDAGMTDAFTALLGEAGQDLPAGKPRHKSEDAAMLLSLIPGAGLAYAGDYLQAGKYFLLNSSILALGTGAFLSGLYISTFVGGGMLLHATLPKSTDLAVSAVSRRNAAYIKEYYAPVYEAIKQSLKNQGTPEP